MIPALLFPAIGLFVGAMSAPTALAAAPAGLQDHPKTDDAARKTAFNAATAAMERFRIPEGFLVSLWAAEPDLANPVAFDVDHKGRVFVAETFRQETEGVPDNRSHRYWIDDDLQLQTVEERGAMYLKHHPEYAEDWTRNTDRIVRLVDSDGDGVADERSVFADGFTDLLDGTGAGVLVRGTEAWYTCIPKLWKLTDADDDGRAEGREALHHGYGVRVALRGHDLHGLVVGPDGRLYFSVGDRGYNVRTKEGSQLLAPGSGAVFRCNLDGTGLEVFATGLRNPQELAFDDLGNLFTGDNNCDAGDAARLVYVMEGGDCGWSMNFQYLPDRGPWMSESWWKPRFDGQAAFLNPPIENMAAGPSGFAFYPGVGMPEAMKGSFFLADFRGGAGNSGVHRFTTKPNGAGFAVDQNEQFWWGVLVTDVAFAPDGSLFLSDWVEGWTGPGKGRMYRMAHTGDDTQKLGRATAAVLAKGMADYGVPALVSLLSHADYRVRLEAQLQLMDLGTEAQAPLVALAQSQAPLHPRVHAIWALGSMGDAKTLEALLGDSDAEIRAQAARSLGECKDASTKALMALAKDPSLRVQYHVAQSLGAIGDAAAVPTLIGMLGRNQNKDRFLRTGASYALSRLANTQQLGAYVFEAESSIALGAVLALRHQRSPMLASYLVCPDPYVATEAAIAIYDLDIEVALPNLVRLLVKYSHGMPDPMSRRALHAANRLGEFEPILAFAADSANSEKLRKEAADMIANWLHPKSFDAVRNEFRTFAERKPTMEASSLMAQTKGTDFVPLRIAAQELAYQNGKDAALPLLLESLAEPTESLAAKTAILNLLKEQDPGGLAAALEVVSKSEDTGLRKVAAEIQMLKQLDGEPGDDPSSWANLFTALGDENSEKADKRLVAAMVGLESGVVPAGAQLELIEAVEARSNKGSGELKASFDAWVAQMEEEGPWAQFGVSLHGGDAERGRKLFYEDPVATCARCHAIDGQAGVPSEVGPNLSSVGLMRTRQHLLESIVEPNKDISPGSEFYETDGSLLHLSAMQPNFGELLDPRQMRDLVEFLASQRKPERVAVFVHSAGYEHQVAKRIEGQPSLVETSWQSWAKDDPRFEAQLVTDPGWFTADNLNSVDAVFFYTTGDLPLTEAGKEALQAYIENGGGFVGAHCASDTYYGWPWFGEMVGGYFDGHPWNAESTVSVRVEDPEHVACQHLPEPWQITDEIYQFKDPYSRGDNHVIMSLDPEGTDMTLAGMKREDGDYAVAWTKKQARGKVFYTSLGHRPDVWSNPLYRDHLIGGLLWAAR